RMLMRSILSKRFGNWQVQVEARSADIPVRSSRMNSGDLIWSFSAKSRRTLRLGGESFCSISSPQSRRDRRGGAEKFKLGHYRMDQRFCRNLLIQILSCPESLVVVRANKPARPAERCPNEFIQIY